MKRSLTNFITFVLTISTFAYGQDTIELSFTAANNGQYIQMDSIYIKNLTQGDAVTMYAGDTTLVLIITGLNDPYKKTTNNFTIFQNTPNPFGNQTSIEIYIPSKEQVTFEVSNILGARVAMLQSDLNRGFHKFIFCGGMEKFYLVTFYNNNGLRKTLKMINSGRFDQNCRLTYSGPAEHLQNQKTANFFTGPDFTPGDELLVVGYSDSVESGFTDSPESSRLYTLQFARNIACPGLDSLFYAGQWYHTIEVLGQCWMKENLNVGIMINGTQTQTKNGIIEKYCYANNENLCMLEGGLYLWDEIMQYANNEGAQGICPPGWHIPTDHEFMVLEGTADSYIAIGSPVWNSIGFRGLDAGKNLKSTSGWQGNGNGTDLYAFAVLPTGYWYANSFSERTVDAGLWTSSQNISLQPYYRGMSTSVNKIARNAYDQPLGTSVRCLKDL